MTPFQHDVPEAFGREMGCTVADFERSLPGAAAPCPLHTAASGSARIDIGDGRLDLRWRELPPRQIALVRFPRLQVDFAFSAVGAASRRDFMHRFDRYMQRGGG